MLLDNEITAEYLTAAFESDMYNGDYAFITLDFHYQEEWKKKKWYRNDKAFQGKCKFLMCSLKADFH